MAEDIQTFRDHFISIYQSAVSEVARRIDAVTSASPKSGQNPRFVHRRSASSILPASAAEVARREYAQRRGLEFSSSSVGPAERALKGGEVGLVCADLALRYLKARLSKDAEALTQIQGEFKSRLLAYKEADALDMGQSRYQSSIKSMSQS